MYALITKCFECAIFNCCNSINIWLKYSMYVKYLLKIQVMYLWTQVEGSFSPWSILSSGYTWVAPSGDHPDFKFHPDFGGTTFWVDLRRTNVGQVPTGLTTAKREGEKRRDLSECVCCFSRKQIQGQIIHLSFFRLRGSLRLQRAAFPAIMCILREHPVEKEREKIGKQRKSFVCVFSTYAE